MQLLRIHITLTVVLMSLMAQGQNRINYSLYMHDQGAFNAAYSNPDLQVSATAHYRKQWLGINGAPTTKNIVANLALNDQHHVTLNIYQDQITVFSDTKLGLGYSYNLQLAQEAFLSFGVDFDYGLFRSDFASLAAQDEGDLVVAAGDMSKGYFNTGIGSFLQTEYFFVGLSFPFVLNNSQLTPTTSGTFPNLRFNHLYFTAGGKIQLDYQGNWFYPTLMMKSVMGAPIQFDLNANFLIYDQVWLGAGFRTDRTFILSAGFVFEGGVKFVYSYDMAALAHSNTSVGSHELLLGYELPFLQKRGFAQRRYRKTTGISFFKIKRNPYRAKF